mmetsp:Transcript_15840/g.64748  ORF Transcript_15840/g.64748 Transcript_15840/m.64748 type:complete len:82 (+) Transcript_15840:174-419(+)
MFAFQSLVLLSSVERRLTVCSARDPRKNPGDVKQGFYKRPSKAIEKGGGEGGNSPCRLGYSGRSFRSVKRFGFHQSGKLVA